MARVWGVAYHLPDKERGSILQQLDYREKGGYSRLNLLFYPATAEKEQIEVVAYVGGECNDMFAGPADVYELAAQIMEAVGPSGSNREYLMRLSEAMRRLASGQAAKDESHVFQVEAALLNLEQQANHWVPTESDLSHHPTHP